jgi:WD40 repeat protein
MLRWWEVQSGECVWVREAHLGTVRSLRSSPDGSRLASCGDDGAITLWDLYSGEHLHTLRRDRPYERLTIMGIRGLTEAQKATLRGLGATEDAPVQITQQAP